MKKSPKKEPEKETNDDLLRPKYISSTQNIPTIASISNISSVINELKKQNKILIFTTIISVIGLLVTAIVGAIDIYVRVIFNK